MTVSLTDRDALVVLVIGSSNSAGNTNATSKSLTRPAGTVNSRCRIWGRWLTGTTARYTPGGSYDWEPITATQNLNNTDVSPVFALAQMYSNVVYGDSHRYAPGAHFGGKPKGVYFVQYSASSSRATQDASQVSPGASWYPKAKNTGAVTAYETFVNLYLNEALTNLQADPDVDRIFLDCVYVIGNESAGYAASTFYAFDRTVSELVPGMSMLHSELARQIDIGSNELVEITVKPAALFAEFVNGTADTSRIPNVRTAFDDYEKSATWPISVVDGSLFDIYSRSVDFSINLTVAGGNQVDYVDSSGQLTLTQAGANFEVKVGPGDVVEFDFTQSAQQSTGTGTVISTTASTVTIGTITFTAGSLVGGDVTGSAYTATGSVVLPAASDNELNHYTGQGVIQMGEALFQARRALDAPVVHVFDNDSDGWNAVEDIEGANS